MNFLGKIIGGICGALILGPIGAVIGVFIGHIFDRGLKGALQVGNLGKTKQTFFNSTFAVMGHIAKSDGRVSENEIQMARAIMQRMGLDENGKRRAIEQFNFGKHTDFELHACLQNLHHTCRFQYLLKMFLDMQVQAAFADGRPSRQKQQLLQSIARDLNLPPIDFAHIEAMMYGQARQSYTGGQSSSQQQYRPSTGLTLDEAYRILGVTPQTPANEVKRAYRKLMSENHPDKLVSKGLPEDMIKVATEKTQQIQKAYDLIKNLNP
tara:strand:+ start:38531 stop:39328 length:798 start_codon:yes stop_codon:yes gene_type:complete